MCSCSRPFQLRCWPPHVTGLHTDPGRVFRQPPSCWSGIRHRHHSKLMHVGEGLDPPSLNINGNVVEFVDSVVYLGSTVTNNGDLKPEIERRHTLWSNVMQVLRKPLWRQQSISHTTKMRIYNAAVLSVLLYGTETWLLTGTLSSRLDSFDSRALRSILGIHWCDLISNEMMRVLAGQIPASSLAARRRVHWHGHVLHLPPHHPSRVILDFHPGSFGWKRPQGAPQTRWFHMVKRNLD